MSSTAASLTTGSAGAQSRLWGARARDWADLQEHHVTNLYQAVLGQLAVGDSTEYRMPLLRGGRPWW